ncbi:hypothetical protein, partial [Bartonella sp. CL27QHWL]|uniref:hypothetical protein n=1 Tax=Bartonella sp. CL27QHWL TaxID=3243521 RepID=UPI0035D10265
LFLYKMYTVSHGNSVRFRFPLSLSKCNETEAKKGGILLQKQHTAVVYKMLFSKTIVMTVIGRKS